MYRSPDPLGLFAYGCLSGAQRDPEEGIDLTVAMRPSALRAACFEVAHVVGGLPPQLLHRGEST